jgi:hypothetical protein
MNYKIAVYGPFVANVILAGLQLSGAVSSGSLSLITTMADTIFDPLSNVTLIVAKGAVNRVDGRRFLLARLASKLLATSPSASL